MSIFRRRFKDARKADENPLRDVRDLQNLTLQELAAPIFPRIARRHRITEIPVHSPLRPASTARDAFLDKQIQLTEYLHILQEAVNRCPQEDFPYVWLAELYLSRGEYQEANRWVFEGLKSVREFERLAFMAACIYLRIMDPAALGWFMQSCILGSFEFRPYLFCARCAEVAELRELYRRLLNASDAISMGSRVPDDEERIANMAKRIGHEELVQAMTRFHNTMDAFLPGADVFPEPPAERSAFIMAHSDDIPHDIRVKLLRAPPRSTK
jgi:hypothetical protein